MHNLVKRFYLNEFVTIAVPHNRRKFVELHFGGPCCVRPSQLLLVYRAPLPCIAVPMPLPPAEILIGKYVDDFQLLNYRASVMRVDY